MAVGFKLLWNGGQLLLVCLYGSDSFFIGKIHVLVLLDYAEQSGSSLLPLLIFSGIEVVVVLLAQFFSEILQSRLLWFGERRYFVAQVSVIPGVIYFQQVPLVEVDVWVWTRRRAQRFRGNG